MRTFTILFFVLVALSSACASKTRPITSPTETLSELVERLKADEEVNGSGGKSATGTQAPANETPEERAIQVRAREIERAEAEKREAKERAKSEPSSVKQARKEFARVDKVEKREDEATRLADVSGCAPGTVRVNPGAVRLNWFERKLGYVHSVRIVNDSSVTYDVQTSSRGLGTVVGNLCPGGSASLFFTRATILENNRVETIHFVAVSRPEAGRVKTNQFQLTLYANSWSSSTSKVWTLR
jgi:hypothetical protein